MYLFINHLLLSSYIFFSNYSLILFLSSICYYNFVIRCLVEFLYSNNYWGFGIYNYKLLYCSSKYIFPPKYYKALIFNLYKYAYFIIPFWGYWYLYKQTSHALFFIYLLPLFIYCRTTTITTSAATTYSAMMYSINFIEWYKTNAAFLSIFKLTFIHRINI